MSSLTVDCVTLVSIRAGLREAYSQCGSHKVALDEPVRGRAVLLESFITIFGAFLDNLIHPEHIFEDGEWAIIEWHGGGTFLGSLGDIAPTGRAFTLRGCGLFKIADGRIRFHRGYFDRYTWFSQIGVPFPSIL